MEFSVAIILQNKCRNGATDVQASVVIGADRDIETLRKPWMTLLISHDSTMKSINVESEPPPEGLT